jgi:hypothetical protein
VTCLTGMNFLQQKDVDFCHAEQSPGTAEPSAEAEKDDPCSLLHLTHILPQVL